MSCMNNCRAGLAKAVLRSVVQLATSLSLLCAMAQSAAAQTEPRVAEGARVRVVIPAADGQSQRRVTGTLVRLTGDTVVMMPGGVVALNEGRRLERLVWSRDQGGKGAVIGAVIGAFTGAVIGAVTWEPCTETGWFACFMYPSQELQAAGGAILGAAGGALVGSMIGRLIRTETWRPLHAGSVSLTVAPRAAGISLAF